MIALLERYKSELEDILSRFTTTSDGIHIDQKDDARLRELALVLRDLFDDAFVDGRRHSQPLVSYFNDSVSNYVGSPSYRGVQNIKGVVASALERVRHNPLALKTAALKAKARGAKDPDAVLTLAERFHAVVRQIRKRHDSRSTLDVADGGWYCRGRSGNPHQLLSACGRRRVSVRPHPPRRRGRYRRCSRLGSRCAPLSRDVHAGRGSLRPRRRSFGSTTPRLPRSRRRCRYQSGAFASFGWLTKDSTPAERLNMAFKFGKTGRE